MIKMIIAMSSISDHKALKKSYLIKFYIICMDIQRVSNSLSLIWRSQGSLVVSIPLVLNPTFLGHIFRISGDKPRWILNISIAKTCKFLWCIETELSLFSSSWNVDVLSWYVILRALSCIEFILLLRRLLWNIQINGQ